MTEAVPILPRELTEGVTDRRSRCSVTIDYEPHLAQLRQAGLFLICQRLRMLVLIATGLE
jgi:hypothetical protein